MDFPIERCRAALMAACLAVVAAGCSSSVPASLGTPAAPAPAAGRPAAAQPSGAPASAPPQTTFASAHGLPVTVKEIGPSGQAADLQIVTLFDKASRQAFAGSMTDLDKRLGGFVARVRDSGQFQANALETLVITPPPGSIPARRLLLVGLGDSRRASLDLMERVGAVIAREAVRLRASTVAFAPTLRDQSFDALDTGQVAARVMTGAIRGYDTEVRLQRQGLAPCFALKHWYYEAGAAYFADVSSKVGPALKAATAQVNGRGDQPFGRTGPHSAMCRS